MAKKIQKYVPQTKMPKLADKYMQKLGKYKALSSLMPYLERHAAVHGDNYFLNRVNNYVEHGGWTDDNWLDVAGRWMVRNVYERAWTHTPEFEELNTQFMKEYDEREDLHEIYKECFPERYWHYDRDSRESIPKEVAIEKGWGNRPTWWGMYHDVVEGGNNGRNKIEKSRVTPYEEGDLVLLRSASVGKRHVDPLFDWSNTPDSSTQRLGTVMQVTDDVGGWRGTKGNKLIRVMWFGQDDVVNVMEKHLKWLERPTYANGLKKREQ